MNCNRSFALDDDRARRAALRDRILVSARLLGWPTRTTVAFTEQVTRHPWKRCRDTELAEVLDELHAILGVGATHGRNPQNFRVRAADRRTNGRDTDADSA